ncbi:hypothetical protein TWF506_000125 [Arthrobotrys conoides]|uniref:Uncharacterized protein n=1 Tax=Arthrobotrys conoides TaxID=74498 RepID=A0AAN8NV89_9PEZI
MAVHIRTREAVDAVINLLSTKLPVELALDIVELAEYYPNTILGSRVGPSQAHYSYQGTASKTYLVVQIPFLDSINSGEGDIQQTAEGQQHEPRRRVVQKIIFRTSSHDQGYGGEPGCPGTYRGAFSWLSADIWRKKTETYKKDMEAALASQAKIVEANGGDSKDEGTYHHWCMHHGYTKIGQENDYDEIDEEYSDPGYTPGWSWAYEHQAEQELRETKGRALQKIRPAKWEYYKVGSWVLQRNVCAKLASTEHEIVWDAAVDGPGPDVELWGSENGYKDENGQPMATGWLENGRVNNSTFVKELREGDEVRVMMQAHFGGWSCTAVECEVECWWAV